MEVDALAIELFSVLIVSQVVIDSYFSGSQMEEGTGNRRQCTERGRVGDKKTLRS